MSGGLRRSERSAVLPEVPRLGFREVEEFLEEMETAEYGQVLEEGTFSPFKPDLRQNQGFGQSDNSHSGRTQHSRTDSLDQRDKCIFDSHEAKNLVEGRAELHKMQAFVLKDWRENNKLYFVIHQ